MAIDRDAAIAFTKASIHTPSIKKFLTISYICSRHGRPPWWSDEDWAAAQKANAETLATYFKAKVAADEVLTVLAKERLEKEKEEGVKESDQFCGISLRPGFLTDGKAGRVKMGKIESRGSTARATVAETIVQVLDTEGGRGWFDVLDGDENVGEAVKRLVSEGFDAVDGEDLKAMRERVAQL